MGENGGLRPLSIIVIGAGIGGLVSSIACRRGGLDVRILEQAPEIKPIGAGIQVPPNAGRVLSHLGLLDRVYDEANEVKHLNMRRYTDGKLLGKRPVQSDTPWMVIHRADYHKVLLEEATRLGVEILLDARVTHIDFGSNLVTLADDRTLVADVVIGADGLWSASRSQMLGKVSEPFETGDLAYRGTFTLEQLQQLHDPRVNEMCQEAAVNVWLGPLKHCVLYPVRNSKEFNMVLLRPDNIPAGSRTVEGDIGEMRQTFEGWDDVLTKIISCIPSVLKWKLMHHDELEQWTKGSVALLGDACHPTLPYQAQGAAMAVEDGGILGTLLSLLNRRLLEGVISARRKQESIVEVLRLYETCQKHRTTTNVQGAINNRNFYHMVNGPEQEARDAEMARHSWTNERSKHLWCDMAYNRELLGTDVLPRAEALFEEWLVKFRSITPVEDVPMLKTSIPVKGAA